MIDSRLLTADDWQQMIDSRWLTADDWHPTTIIIRIKCNEIKYECFVFHWVTYLNIYVSLLLMGKEDIGIGMRAYVCVCACVLYVCLCVCVSVYICGYVCR